MNLFGSLKELVAVVFRKNSQEITLRPNQSTTYTAARDIQLPPGDADQVLSSASATETLTNKTIDGDSNTVQDIGISSLKTVGGDANKILRRDGSGAVVSGNAIPNSSAVVTTDSTSTLTNKTLTGAAISGGQIDAVPVGSATPDSGAFTTLSASSTVTFGGAAATTASNTQTLTNKTINGSSNTITNVSLTTGVTGTLPIGNGGTGQTTQTAAFDALAPTTTKGDLIASDGTDNVRVPVGTDGQALVANSANASGLGYASVLTNPMTTTGDIIVGGASGVATRVAAGADNRVLAGNGAGVAPGYQQLDSTDFFSSTVYETGSFSVGITGPSTSSHTFYYARIGKLVVLSWGDYTGTSSAAANITLDFSSMPSSIRPVSRVDVMCLRTTSNSAFDTDSGFIRIPTSGAGLLSRGGGAANFAASGSYGFGGAGIAYITA